MTNETASGANGAGRKADPVLATVLEALSRSDRQSVLEILRNNRPKDSPLSGLAQNLQLKPEQEALFNVLLGLEQERGVVDVDVEEVEEKSMGARNAGLQQELADLREVNDTLAAALGACPACWGGDPECSECSGLGHPGSNRHDTDDARWRPGASP